MRPVATDALQLPFPNAHFDGCVAGFEVNNLADLAARLAEIARVLKRGKRVVVPELSTPSAWVPRQLNAFYLQHVLPLVGYVVSKHMTAYRYLPDSVRQFPQERVLVDSAEPNGHSGARQQRATSGVASLYWGLPPETGCVAESPRDRSTADDRRDSPVLQAAQVLLDVSPAGWFGAGPTLSWVWCL